MAREVDIELGLAPRHSRAHHLLHLVLRLKRRKKRCSDAQPLEDDGKLHDERLKAQTGRAGRRWQCLPISGRNRRMQCFLAWRWRVQRGRRLQRHGGSGGWWGRHGSGYPVIASRVVHFVWDGARVPIAGPAGLQTWDTELLQSGGELFGPAGHHPVKDARMLRNIDMDGANGEEAGILLLATIGSGRSAMQAAR